MWTGKFKAPSEDSLQNLLAEYIKQKCRGINLHHFAENIYCIGIIKSQTLLLATTLGWKHGNYTCPQHLSVDLDCQMEVQMKRIKDMLLFGMLPHLCRLTGNYVVTLFILTMESFLSFGLSEPFIEEMIRRWYPRHIEDAFNNFKIRNIGQHWVREEIQGDETILYDSHIVPQVKALTEKPYTFLDGPQQVHRTTCGLLVLFYELFKKHGLRCTPGCLTVKDPEKAVYDMMLTFFFDQGSESEFITRYMTLSEVDSLPIAGNSAEITSRTASTPQVSPGQVQPSREPSLKQTVTTLVTSIQRTLTPRHFPTSRPLQNREKATGTKMASSATCESMALVNPPSGHRLNQIEAAMMSMPQTVPTPLSSPSNLLLKQINIWKSSEKLPATQLELWSGHNTHSPPTITFPLVPSAEEDFTNPTDREVLPNTELYWSSVEDILDSSQTENHAILPSTKIFVLSVERVVFN